MAGETGTSVDYFAICNELAERIRIDLPDVSVLLEEPVMFTHEMPPTVGIYLEGIEVSDQQPIAMGLRQRERLQISVWIWVFSVDIQTGIKLRNSLRMRIRNVLMRNRTLNGFVDTLWEAGGSMASARVESDLGFVVGAEIAILAPVMTVTTQQE